MMYLVFKYILKKKKIINLVKKTLFWNKTGNRTTIDVMIMVKYTKII